MLTARQKQIFDFINTTLRRRKVAPTHWEIARHFRLSSPATVHEHLQALREKGYLEKQPRRARAIQIRRPKRDLITIPLLGTIAAGEPIEATSSHETTAVPKDLISKSGNHYALKVAGDSMIRDGIFDGDTVIIRHQQIVENGETAVALINGDQVTLKRIYKEKNGYRLQPANPNSKSIFVKDLFIQGKVISVIRNFEKPRETIEKGEFNAITLEYMREADMSRRRSLGQYFTPRSIREKLLERLPQTTKNPLVLDPACGTGEFLITARKYFKNPKLHGWEIDKNLIEISRGMIPNAKLKSVDSLLNDEYGKFDFVIGNPPYFEFSPSEKARKKFRHIINGRVNIFGLFIYQGIHWLKEGGYLAYVVPPSMNNGAYFQNLRKFIIENSNIEYLHILKGPRLFQGALQSTMLLLLRKGKNRGNYVFKKNGVLIFSEKAKYLEKSFEGKTTLNNLDYHVRTGRLVWNQNRHLLTNDPKDSIPLIWAHNITEKGLTFPLPREEKPQYARVKSYDVGPAVVVNRIVGSIDSVKLKAAIIPPGMKFIAENHVNVIYPPSKKAQQKIGFGNQLKRLSVTISGIAKQLSSKDSSEIIKSITGNTQISKNELEKLFPIEASA